MMKRTCC